MYEIKCIEDIVRYLRGVVWRVRITPRLMMSARELPGFSSCCPLRVHLTILRLLFTILWVKFFILRV